MPWAVFHRPFEFDFRPARAVCQEIRPSQDRQEFPDRVIAAAVKAGVAKRVKAPTAIEKRALKGRQRAR